MRDRSRWFSGRRPGLRIAAASVLGVVLLGLAGPAWAHDGDHEDDAEHAATDLAGTPMATIEQDTAANQARLARSGADASSAAKAARQEAVTDVAAGAEAALDPGQFGSWTAPVATEVLPVFQAVLPNGKVLMWDSVGDKATENYTDHTFTRAMVWNPADNRFRRVDVAGYNIFCAGYVHLPDGNVLVVGGNKNAALDGIRQTHLFDWRSETWTRGPDMAAERWYPSVAALANGEAVIVAGGSNRAEVYQTDGALRTLTGFTSFGDRVYPFLVPRNDGRVELVGPGTQLGTMTTAGAGSLDATRTRDGINRDYGSFATFLPGRTLVTGGGSVSEEGLTQVPTRTSVIVDTTGATTTTTSAASMNQRRRQHNLTVLADGSVLATGGQSRSVDGLVDLANPVLAAERWDPTTNTWTTLAPAARIREYHATAALLPDGRVLTGGGGICGTCVAQGYLEKNLETFSPPYLYRRDGSGQLATRPTVSGVPATAAAGTTFTATSPAAGSITKIGLVRLGAPTHSVDQGQRYVPLTFSASGSTLTINAPADNNLAPPGYYMLFATDTQGVPSVASFVQITTRPTTPERANLALGRPATASSQESTQYPAASANDGDTSTRWSSAFADDQWWQVDLGSAQPVEEVTTVWEAAYARQFRVQTSIDGTSFSTAATVDATTAGAQRTRFSSRTARYVRIQGVTRATSWGFSLFETQVYGGAPSPTDAAPTAAAGSDRSVVAGSSVTLDGSGSSDPESASLSFRWTQTSGTPVVLANATSARPSFTAPASAGVLGFSLVVNDGTSDSVPDAVAVTVTAPEPVNLAQGRPATQSSTYGSYGPGRAVDGSTNGVLSQGSVTRTNADRYSWWQVDLGGSRTPEQIVVWNRTDAYTDRLRDFRVFASESPFTAGLSPSQQAARTVVWSVRLQTTPNPSTTIALPNGTRARYVMVQQNRTAIPLSLAEVRVLDLP